MSSRGKVLETQDVRFEFYPLSHVEVVRKLRRLMSYGSFSSVGCQVDASLPIEVIEGGDANTRFLHDCVVQRRQNNSIMALQMGDSWMDKHFTNHSFNRPNLNGLVLLLSFLERYMLFRTCLLQQKWIWRWLPWMLIKD